MQNNTPPKVHQMTIDKMLEIIQAVKEHKPLEWQQKFGMDEQSRIWHKFPYPYDDNVCLNFCAYNYRIVPDWNVKFVKIC